MTRRHDTPAPARSLESSPPRLRTHQWLRGRRGRLAVCSLALLLMARLLTTGPAPAGADSQIEYFFKGAAPCPMAHCNPFLDGREMDFPTKTILSLGVSTPPAQTAVASYTPQTPVSFNSGLGCSVGLSLVPATPVPNQVECDGTQPTLVPTPTPGGTGNGPYVYNLTASGAPGSAALGLNWTSAPYPGAPTATCTPGSPFPMNGYVGEGAPLFSDLGYSYVSDSASVAKYQAVAGSGNQGLCQWGVPNPAQAAMISWNVVYLPPNGTGSNHFLGDFFLVGQGISGPVLMVGYGSAQVIAQLNLPDSNGGSYITYNTISEVQTSTGARIYDSTADCPASGCTPLEQLPGRLYAIDLTSPTVQGGTPTMTVAWYFDFEGPSGASPMLLPASSGAPYGDRIFFDGSGDTVCTGDGPCPLEHPHLFGIEDSCHFGGVCIDDPSAFMDIDLSQSAYGESGKCGTTYEGIQAAAALEGPETQGGDYSLWTYATCGTTLYRFDAETGNAWTSSQGGATRINVGNISLGGQTGYIPSSTMNTVIDSDSPTSDTTMFVGAEVAAGSFKSYVLALDLETGSLLWSVLGPSAQNMVDTPFNGQFPIAKTTSGGYVLIGSTRGEDDGSSIIAIPLS